MREISEISADLTKLAADVQAKTKAKNEAEEVYNKTSQALAEIHVKANELRTELNEALNLLVPVSMQGGRVRQTP